MMGGSYIKHSLFTISDILYNTITIGPILHSSHVMLPYKMNACTWTTTWLNYSVTPFFYELYVQSIHTNIPLCKTERKLTINITTQYNSITSHQKYLLVKKISDKKNRFGTEVIKLVNNAYCTFSSRFQ